MSAIPSLHVRESLMGHFPSSPLYRDRRMSGRCKDATFWRNCGQQGHQLRAASSASVEVLPSERANVPCPSLQSPLLFHESCDTLVPEPTLVHQPGCPGTHKASHSLFHCPFYTLAGKEPLGASHTFSSDQGRARCQGRADPRDFLRTPGADNNISPGGGAGAACAN